MPRKRNSKFANEAKDAAALAASLANLTQQVQNGVGGGGTFPSNGILFENWTGKDILSVVLPDTTPPVLTITPSSSFYVTQTVTMSTNESATIWYTVDGSDPTTSLTKVQYSSPVTLTSTITIKAYAIDTAQNASTVQIITYTKNSALAYDSFNRSDNATSLGTADVGGAYQILPSGAVFGINNNQAYVPNSAGSYPCAGFDVTGNYAVEISITNIATAQYMFLHGMYTSGSTFTGLMFNSTTLNLVKRVSNALTTIASSATKAKNGDVLRLECLTDGTLRAYLNGIKFADVVDSTNLKATNRVGFGVYSDTAARFDEFKITQL